MKIRQAFLLFTLPVYTMYSQTKDTYEKVAENYFIYTVPSIYSDLQNTFYYYEKDLDNLRKKQENAYYNNVVLNKYFGSIITNYASSTGDFSLTNYFINADATAGRLTIGGSFRLDNLFGNKAVRTARKQLKPLRKLNWIGTLYASSNLSDGFSNIYSKNSDTELYNFESNIGIGGKITYAFNNTITSKKMKTVDDVREKFVEQEIDKLIADYKKSSFDKDVALKKIENPSAADIEKSIVREKHREFYDSIAAKELAYAKRLKLITDSHARWISFSFYIPVTRKEVSFSTDGMSVATKRFGNWSFTGQYNYLYNRYFDIFKWSSVKCTLESSVFNTNEFIALNQPSTEIEGQANVFSGAYNQFTGGYVKGEISSLLFNNLIGVSAAYEITTGEIQNKNWKLGIPVSLKDKDGKPTVNFEL